MLVIVSSPQVLRVVVDMLYRLESPASHKKTVQWFEEDIMKKPSLTEYGSAEVQVVALVSCELVYIQDAMKAFHEEIVDSLSFLFEQCDVLEAELQSYRTTQVSRRFGAHSLNRAAIQVSMKERRQLEFEHFMRVIR